MKIEASLAAKKRISSASEFGHLVKFKNGEKKIAKKKSCTRIKMCRVFPKTAIQILFDTCKEVFGGPGTVPLPLDVLKLQFILDRIKPADLGVREDMPCFKTDNTAQGTPRVTYVHIYQCPTFSMGIFLLTPSATIPLHNHPGMTVFSKLLFGSMHLKAYDWVNDPVILEDTKPSSHLGRLARLKIDSVYVAPKTSVLFPAAGGNIHSLQAVTPCAVLDVLGPPYDVDRDSTYYRDIPLSGHSDTSSKKDDTLYGWLEAIEKPEDLAVDCSKYMGPQIVDDWL